MWQQLCINLDRYKGVAKSYGRKPFFSIMLRRYSYNQGWNTNRNFTSTEMDISVYFVVFLV